MSSDDSNERSTTIVLSERDWEAFMAALEHPPTPNAALKGLMEEFGPWEDSAPISTKGR